MSDAWEILVDHSTAGDAWERLNSITGGTCVAGQPITELIFTFNPVASITGSIEIPALAGPVSPVSVSGSISGATLLSGTISAPALTGVIEVEEI